VNHRARSLVRTGSIRLVGSVRGVSEAPSARAISPPALFSCDCRASEGVPWLGGATVRQKPSGLPNGAPFERDSHQRARQRLALAQDAPYNQSELSERAGQSPFRFPSWGSRLPCDERVPYGRNRPGVWKQGDR